MQYARLTVYYCENNREEEIEDIVVSQILEAKQNPLEDDLNLAVILVEMLMLIYLFNGLNFSHQQEEKKYWLLTNIFHTLLQCKDRLWILIVDGRSAINVLQ